MKTKVTSVWAWAIVQKRGEVWVPVIASVSRIRAGAIEWACSNYHFHSEPVRDWRYTKNRFNLRAVRVEISPVLFGKELE